MLYADIHIMKQLIVTELSTRIYVNWIHNFYIKSKEQHEGSTFN